MAAIFFFSRERICSFSSSGCSRSAIRFMSSIRRMDYVDEWNRVAGFARLYAYEAGKGAEHYLSKSCYAWKHGEIDLGGPLAGLLKEKDTAGLFG